MKKFVTGAGLLQALTAVREKLDSKADRDAMPLVTIEANKRIDNTEYPLVLYFDRPVPMDNCYIQPLRLSKRKRGSGNTRIWKFRRTNIACFLAGTSKVKAYPVPKGAAHFGFTKAMLDAFYMPPLMRGSAKSWPQWAGTQSGERHNPQSSGMDDVRRHSAMRCKFAVSHCITGAAYIPGKPSAQVLSIKKFFAKGSDGLMARQTVYRIE